jgi:uncharacterized protein (TIGR00369 family)
MDDFTTTFPEPEWTAADVQAFVERAFPAAAGFGARITAVARGRLTAELPFDPGSLRPGGTISGPTQMTLADTAFYYLLLCHLGEEALAVTTSLSFTFLRKPSAGATLVADARLLKLGKRLAVGDVLITAEGLPVAHAQVTYSRVPPDRRVTPAG